MAMYDYDEFSVIYTGRGDDGEEIEMQSGPTRSKSQVRTHLRNIQQRQRRDGVPQDAAVHSRHVHMGVSAWQETTIT